MKKYVSFVFFTAIIAVVLLMQIPSAEAPSVQTKINGMSLVAPRKSIGSSSLASIKKVNANWIALMPYAFGEVGSSKLVFNQSHQWWGERKEGVAQTIRQAHDKGLKVMVKPHVWVHGQGWTGDFSLNNDRLWQQWEARYRNYILTYARVADSLHAEMLCIGTEFRKVVNVRPAFWHDLIENVRKVYHGKLTYAANWDNYQNVTFWDDLDYIGIDAYFPLSSEKSPETDQLKEQWAPVRQELADFSKQEHTPILFTEFGYRSINYAAEKPWEDRRAKQEDINLQAQSNAYRALLEVFWGEPWFAGGFAWKWRVDNDHNKRRRRNIEDGYTPQGKPAEEVLKNWYGQTTEK